MSDPHWIEKAVAGMKKKGTVGSFGKATPSKISAGKKSGGLQKKKAIFAQNVSHISKSNRGTHYTQGGVPGDRSEHYQPGNAVEAREAENENVLKKGDFIMPTKLQERHGAIATGNGHPENMGTVGPTNSFKGRTSPQDIDRKVSESQVGNDSGPKNPKIKGVTERRTGGMNRKFAGKVGFQKATGTK